MLNRNSVLNNLFLVKCKIHVDKRINFQFFIKYRAHYNVKSLIEFFFIIWYVIFA